MRHHCFWPVPLLLLSTALIRPAPAQVTGVPGINDYTINGLGSGGTSCIPLCIPSPTTLTLVVNTVPGNAVIVFFSDCPCRGCSFPWLPNACVPPIPPALAPPCSGLTNQSIDIFFGVPGCTIVFSQFLFANAAGVASLVLPVPPFGSVPCSALFSTQSLVFDLCGTGGSPPGPGPFVLTQAYSIAF